ncbi:hypothetical protein CONCODRAFT_3375 [Conidiobolus coronatus NRRL 28638]|uniref:IgA peptidase M64-domain-containing protein n=1 Tax=Conidiobolus coronatus (strain ATCC 28846 / CBS 209.66 / NRRL 28638) TaxID=796925 RepID=A0A137PFA6_CONC2|nr:hypothetical protein CONCODRAFT_3375 [Conidiobolus coronatus NRRL 28638]|eukprot:KXN73689.1 hypothetical protein CONCODRAFT_3375 [Conidiobolus coronatus NRRL 28638]
MKSLAIVAWFSQTLLLQVSGQVYYKKYIRSADGSCSIVEDSQVPKFASLSDDQEVKVFRKNAVAPSYDTKIQTINSDEVFETYSKSKIASQANLDLACSKKNLIAASLPNERTALIADEVRKVVDNGSPSNRIDVVFMGDGYTASERTKFFDDLARLTKEMFEGETFKSWLPLFNIWGIHVASTDSGIGYNGPKNTPFKLYRQQGQLRAIFTGNAAAARTKCKLTGTNACDYPALLANDDFYGGLGGEFVISTRSERTGTVVLRHEMGHNFIDVGEEYDDGQVYDGVNSATSLNTLGWKNWLSGPLREEREIYRLLEYPWHDLSTGPKSHTFTSDGKFNRWYLLISVTAAGQADSLEFSIDGKVLPWQSRGSDDREFYGWYGSTGFSAGQHTLTVRSKTGSTNPNIPRMLSSITLHEYGNEDEFKISNDYYSAYPTWDINGSKTYRPTNEGCIMRNMTSSHFCNVCKEGMWYQFLNKISLIDGVAVSNGKATVSPLKLGQLRPTNQQILGEKLEIRWFKSNILQSNLNDQLTVPVVAGSWSVQVKLTTPEVRSDPSQLLTATKAFTV